MKKILKIIGVIVLLLALGGFWVYDKYFKPDPEIQQQLKNDFGEEFFNSFEDEKVINNPGTPKEPETVDDVKAVDDTVKRTDSPMISDNSNPVNDNSVVKQITQEDIHNKYQTRFLRLQNVALSRLDTLYSAAVQEYVQGEKDGTLNRSKLVQKYIQAGTTLEANMDSQVYGILSTMEAELNANNFSSEIVGVYKNKYENAKSDKRSQLMAQILK
ncbi:MAG: hypothetical protein ACOYIB_02615 [Desulfosporosinus sp.]|jgi:hypothetical protein